MALRICNKINSGIIQNFCRQLSAKADLASSVVTSKDVAKKEEISTAKPQVYSLGQMRSSNINKKYNVHQMSSEMEIAKKNIENQSLQPSMLPNYYENTMDLGLTFGSDEAAEGNRQFRKSSTQSKVTLPLRPSRLASPFPEPVKVMQSHTVSDEEKAAQMLADSRAPKYGQREEQKNLNFMPHRPFSTASTLQRKKGNSDSTVSTDPKKCKKLKRDDKKSCTKMRLPGCEAPKRKTCRRQPMVVKCKKQEAPYPSYSESCHEDIEAKPSECKLCPWKPDQHPYFRPKKSKYHTTTSQRAQDRGQAESQLDTVAARGEEDQVFDGSAQDPLEAQQVLHEQSPVMNEADAVVLPASYQCDLRKKPCKKPKSSRCAEANKKGKHRKGRGKRGRKGNRNRGKRRNRKGKRNRGRNKKKRNRRGSKKKRTMGWGEAARVWAEHGGKTSSVPSPGLGMEWLEDAPQKVAVTKFGKKEIRRPLNWREANRVWSDRAETGDEAASADISLASGFQPAPPHPDLNHEAGIPTLIPILCKKKRSKGKGKKGKKKKKKGKKGSKGKKKKPKCKKFPMGDCTAPKRRGNRDSGKCPPKKRKKLVKDCPPQDEGGCKKGSSWLPVEEYNLPSREMLQQPYVGMFAKGDKKKNCPRVDLTTAKDSDVKPCPKKKKKSHVCPGNLLKKKKRKKYRGTRKRKRRGDDRNREHTRGRTISQPLSLRPYISERPSVQI